MLTDSVKALVAAAKEAAHLADVEGRSFGPVTGNLCAAIAAVEAESAREEAYECNECEGDFGVDSDGAVCPACFAKAAKEAVEHAIARRALEAVQERGMKWKGSIVRGGHMALEIDRQLSLLGARNVEVVEIPQGEECDRCAFEYDCFDCQNPMEPAGEEPPRGTRPDWCRSRYGVEAKP